jgi:threonine/homoserine/homoserine lactone efflux protein
VTSTPQLLAFASVVTLGAISPGPDFAVVVRRSAMSGRGHGMAATGGVAVGVFTWAVAAGTGVAALVAASVLAFTVVKIVGAAYLLYLGIKAVRSAMRGDGGKLASGDGRTGTGRWSAFQEGLLCNALNPKAAMFFVALMPQFLTPGAAIGEVAVLSAIALVITTLWFLAVATLVGSLRRVLSRVSVRRAIDALSGTVLIALGLRLAVARPG